jgi:ubiquitin-conjugating enzyme E2 G2
MKFKNKILDTSMNKRLLKELRDLILEQNKKPLLENDYLISFDEANMNKIYTIIKCPYDSVYRHKFVRLNFDIPEDYPHSPPKVTFVNYDNVRIHPNMYENGKCCSTILNTWPSDNEKWTSSMGIETVLLTFHSFFDNNPYTYEPGGKDDPSYTEYVLFQSWKTCLLRYIRDYSQPELFTTFIHNYLMVYIEDIFNDLSELIKDYPYGPSFTRCFEIDNYTINYDNVVYLLEQYYQYIDYKENYLETSEDIDYDTFINKDYICNICFDTNDKCDRVIELSCKHSFHIKCVNNHIENNGNICSLCRNNINIDDLNQITCSFKKTIDDWIINPETKRRVKIGSRTYKRLLDEGIIHVTEI